MRMKEDVARHPAVKGGVVPRAHHRAGEEQEEVLEEEVEQLEDGRLAPARAGGERDAAQIAGLILQRCQEPRQVARLVLAVAVEGDDEILVGDLARQPPQAVDDGALMAEVEGRHEDLHRVLHLAHRWIAAGAVVDHDEARRERRQRQRGEHRLQLPSQPAIGVDVEVDRREDPDARHGYRPKTAAPLCASAAKDPGRTPIQSTISAQPAMASPAESKRPPWTASAFASGTMYT